MVSKSSNAKPARRGDAPARRAPAKAGKGVRAAKPGKSAAKAAKAAKAPKAPKTSKTIKATKTTKTTKTTKSTKIVKPVKAVKPAKTVKPAKSVKPVKAVKSANTAASTKAKPARGTKAAKAAKAAGSARSGVASKAAAPARSAAAKPAATGKPKATRPAKAALAPKPAPVRMLDPLAQPRRHHGPALAPSTLERLRVQLLEERARHAAQAAALLAEADELASEREPGDTQFDEESGEGDTLSVERERDLALVAQNTQTIELIDKALARLGTNSYGYCEMCGNRIGVERLEAIPWAELCIKCKSLGERRR